jgi:hypothetical protein
MHPTEVVGPEPKSPPPPPPPPPPQNIDLWGVSWISKVAPGCFGMPCGAVHARSTRHIKSGFGWRVDLQFSFNKVAIAGSLQGFGASWRSQATPARTIAPKPATPPVRNITPTIVVGRDGGGGPTFSNAGRTADHHTQPQKHMDQYRRAGYEPNPYCRRMPVNDHIDVHKQGFIAEWDRFFRDFPDATAEEIDYFDSLMEKIFGTDQYPSVPYRK